MPLLTTGAGAYPSAGASLDPATTAWIAAVVTAGGTVSGTQQGYVDTLIKAYKSAGIFTLMDREWLLWSENIYQAQIDIINLATCSFAGTSANAAFTNNGGYTGVPANSNYIDSGDAQSVVNGQFQQNSAMIDCWIHNNRTSYTTNYYAFGTQYGASYTFFSPYDGSGHAGFGIMTSTGGGYGSSPGTQGYWSLTRTSSTQSDLYLNGTSFVSFPDAVSSFSPSNNIYFANGYGNTNYSADTFAMAGIGAGLNSTQVAAKYAADLAYATSKGF